MSLYKRKDSPNWWVKLSHNGRRVQQSSGTSEKAKAQEYHDKLKASLWDQDRLGIKPSYTWNDAVIRWLAETKHKASRSDDLLLLRRLDKHLNSVMLSRITRQTVDGIIASRLADGATNGTVNRLLAVLRAVLRKAVYEWEWLDRHPKVPSLPERVHRDRFLTRVEADRLIAELPEHLAAMVRFSLETGLRKANVTGLHWSQVDLAKRRAWIHADQAKARRAIGVPLSADAVIVIREQIGKHPEYIFTYRGKPVWQVNNVAWHKALKRAGIDNFRWHDLRHTWASWHAQAGTPMHVLQELGSWRSPEMVRRYAHLSSDHLAEYVDRMSGGVKLVTNNQQLATIQLREEK